MRAILRNAGFAAALAAVPGTPCAQAPDLHRAYDEKWAPRLVPMLVEAIRFPTFAGNEKAFADQKAWLARTAGELGFAFRDAGKVAEVELAGPPGAPVLGLIVHGDVVPVDDHWTFPPFAAEVKDGMVYGRGAADDKGPLVQALLAMKTLADSGRPRTHAIRLLVGSDEESGSTDMKEYLQAHAAPALSLVLDSDFPLVIGEKSGNMLFVETRLASRGAPAVRVVSLDAGIAGNIVPDLAAATLVSADRDALDLLRGRIETRAPAPGIRIDTERKEPGTLVVRARGKAAHAGVNAAGGRNALTALAIVLGPELPEGGARDLLAFARLAGDGLDGAALGFTEVDPTFGRMVVVPTLLRTTSEGTARLGVNIRGNPGTSGEPLKERLLARVAEFNSRTGASLAGSGGFTSKPLVHDPDAKIVKRLMADYRRASGRDDPPAVSAGGTYQKSIPNSITFGMWFPGKPYPGHDVDEKIAIADLQLGTHVLLEALADLACGVPISEPLKP